MWQKVLDSLRLFFNISEEMRRNRETIEQLEKENQQFSLAMQMIAQEWSISASKNKVSAKNSNCA